VRCSCEGKLRLERDMAGFNIGLFIPHTGRQ